MTIYDKPQTTAFAADLLDYRLDHDSSIRFEIKKAGRLILSESYCPDANYGIRTHKLGKICADALWGVWPGGSQTVQNKLADDFSFLIDGVTDQTSYIIASRYRSALKPVDAAALTLSSVKTTRYGAPEWVTVMLSSGESATVYATLDDGSVRSATLFTQSGSKQIITLDVSPSAIAAKFPRMRIVSYSVCGVTFRIDQTQYLEQHCFRFKNNFDCPEGLSATGSLTVHASKKAENAFLYGRERQFRLTPTDEYTVNSGVIFSQSDYKMWHELLTSRQVQVLVDGQWLDIIITKSRYERNFKKNVLKSVEFSFHFADPDENSLL